MSFNVNETNWKKAIGDVALGAAGMLGVLGMVASMFKSALEQKKMELEKLTTKRHSMEAYVEHLVIMRTAHARLMAESSADGADVEVQLHRRDIATYNMIIAMHKERVVELDVQMEALTKEVDRLQKQENEERKARLDEDIERSKQREKLLFENGELTGRLMRIKTVFKKWGAGNSTNGEFIIHMRDALGVEGEGSKP